MEARGHPDGGAEAAASELEPLGGRLLKYALALGFGLIHGMGFSNFLRAALGSEASITRPLFAFNVGLEVGQIVIVGLVLLATWAATRVLRAPRRGWILALSGVTGAVALYLVWQGWGGTGPSPSLALLDVARGYAFVAPPGIWAGTAGRRPVVRAPNEARPTSSTALYPRPLRDGILPFLENRPGADVMRTWREWLPRLLVESVVVMFSILLALLVDEWRDDRSARAAVDWSLQSIEQELERNRDALAEAARYHTGLADTLQTLVASGATEVDSSIRPRGWLLTPELTSAAWRGAGVAGSTAHMPDSVVLVLAGVYQTQAQYVDRREGLIHVLYTNSMQRNSASLLPVFEPLAGIINDVAAWENGLLSHYDRALERLSATAGGS